MTQYGKLGQQSNTLILTLGHEQTAPKTKNLEPTLPVQGLQHFSLTNV
jgi:hypothetical protein